MNAPDNPPAHTPGPWAAENKGTHWNADIDNWIITYGSDGEQIVDHVYEAADARLIAAAPDLLAAAQRVCGGPTRKDGTRIFLQSDIEALESAVASATARTLAAARTGKEAQDV